MDQISELRQCEKVSIAAGGIGFKSELQELIARFTAKTARTRRTDPRIVQARMLWKIGFGRELCIDSFDAYLASIPVIPEGLLTDNPDLPLLVLVDPRLGHTRSTRLAGLKFAEYGVDDSTLVPFDERHVMPVTPYWVRAHDGAPNLGKRPSDCRASCTNNLLAGTADVGIAIWIQHGPCKHVMDLPGSVHAGGRGNCAYVYPFGDPCLVADRSDGASADCGAVVFVRE